MDNAIQAVLFDFDGTLVFQQPDPFDVIKLFCAEVGQPIGAEAERQVRRTRHEFFVDPDMRARLSSYSADQFWQHFNRRLLEAGCVHGDLELFAQELARRFRDLELTYYCPEHSFRTLIELRSRGYKLGLITNRHNVERFHELLDLTELWPYFDLVLASGEVDFRKPEPGIFLAALDRIGAMADQALYIGDNYWADVVGAQRAGVRPALLDPHRIFPEADCLILDRTDDLLGWLP